MLSLILRDIIEKIKKFFCRISILFAFNAESRCVGSDT